MQCLMSTHRPSRATNESEVTGSPPRSVPFTAGSPRLRSDEDRVLLSTTLPRLSLHSPRSCRRDIGTALQLDRGRSPKLGGDHPTHVSNEISEAVLQRHRSFTAQRRFGEGRPPSGPVFHGQDGFGGGRSPGGPVFHGQGSFSDADRAGLDPGGRATGYLVGWINGVWKRSAAWAAAAPAARSPA